MSICFIINLQLYKDSIIGAYTLFRDSIDALLHFGYMHPILSDRGKNLFGYLGLSALCGYEDLNEDKRLLPDGATLLERSRFTYGGAIHISVELFLTDNLLFILKAQGRLLFGSDLHRFRPAISAGLKFNI